MTSLNTRQETRRALLVRVGRPQSEHKARNEQSSGQDDLSEHKARDNNRSGQDDFTEHKAKDNRSGRPHFKNTRQETTDQDRIT